MLSWPRIQDSSLRSNMFHRWVQQKSHRTAACQECSHPPRTWASLILLEKEGLSNIQRSPAHLFQSVTSPHSGPECAASKRSGLCNIFRLGLRCISTASMSNIHFPSTISHICQLFLRAVRPTDLSSNKSRWCQDLILETGRQGRYCVSSLGLQSDRPGLLSYLPCWASVWP